MISQESRRWAYGIAALAAVYLVAFYVIPAFLANSDGDSGSGCTPHHNVHLEHGEHEGRQWRIAASIGKSERNSRCTYWLLKVNFSPTGRSRGSWTEGWSVPAGGHLSPDATIDAIEAEDGRSIGGVVGSSVRSLVLEMTNGRTITVHPKIPKQDLRARFVWLRGLRYFLTFHSTNEHVKAARLLDSKGNVIYTAHAQEGELVGNMVY